MDDDDVWQSYGEQEIGTMAPQFSFVRNTELAVWRYRVRMARGRPLLVGFLRRWSFLPWLWLWLSRGAPSGIWLRGAPNKARPNSSTSL